MVNCHSHAPAVSTFPPTILSPVASPALQYFSTSSHKRHGVRKKKVVEHKMCVLIFSTNFFFPRNFSRCKKTWRRCEKNLYWSSCEIRAVLFDFHETWIFSEDFQKNTHVSDYTKIRPGGAEFSMHTDRHDEAYSGHNGSVSIALFQRHKAVLNAWTFRR